MSVRFKRGDHIRVSPIEGYDKPTVEGAAMATMGFTGYAEFEVKLPGGSVHKFNMNQVNVDVLFSADVARELQPLPDLSGDDPAAAVIFGMMWNVIDQDATLGDIKRAARSALQEILKYIETKRSRES